MLDEETRGIIWDLWNRGHGKKKIAKLVGVSRNTVKKVIRSGSVEPPKIEKGEKLLGHLNTVGELYLKCRGNLVRVHELLEENYHVIVPYSTLTSFCRRHGIGVRKKERSGRYHFEPGAEFQHDTSPHDVEIAGRKRRLQCASAVLCFSRMLFIQVYETYNRFLAKVFLTEAFKYFGAVSERSMIDNTSVIRVGGAGRNAIIAPEMVSFSNYYGFEFKCHEIGDKNRSARVERPFHFVENNFYPGREFKSLEDLNLQARTWCDKVNRKFKKHIQAIPLELFQTERLHMKPLPDHVPEVYQLHMRMVDIEGYITLHTNSYSVPEELIGQRVQVRETKDHVYIVKNNRTKAKHQRQETRARRRITLPEHQFPGRWKKKKPHEPATPQEEVLRNAGPELSQLVVYYRKKYGGTASRYVKKLYHMYLDYPTDALVQAVRTALEFKMYDLRRIEKMTLKHIAGNFFRISSDEKEPTDE